jgi:quinolinate synthase
VLAEADYVGSTAGMIREVGKAGVSKVVMITECSMSDNLAAEFPEVDFVRPCNLCPHMKRITLPKIYESLRDLKFEIKIDPVLAGRARQAVERMLAVRATSTR